MQYAYNTLIFAILAIKSSLSRSIFEISQFQCHRWIRLEILAHNKLKKNENLKKKVFRRNASFQNGRHGLDYFPNAPNNNRCPLWSNSNN